MRDDKSQRKINIRCWQKKNSIKSISANNKQTKNRCWKQKCQSNKNKFHEFETTDVGSQQHFFKRLDTKLRVSKPKKNGKTLDYFNFNVFDVWHRLNSSFSSSYKSLWTNACKRLSTCFFAKEGREEKVLRACVIFMREINPTTTTQIFERQFHQHFTSSFFCMKVFCVAFLNI